MAASPESRPNLLKLPLRSALFHAKALLPVLLGVAVAAAVFTGALLVGDSLRGSLQARSNRQLVGVESAYIGRPIRIEAANDAIPALILTGAVRIANREEASIPDATAIGFDAKGQTDFGLPSGVILAFPTAQKLGAKVGDEIQLNLEKGSRVPRASLVGQRDASQVTANLKIKVSSVLPPNHAMNDFQLSPSPDAPLNLFLNLNLLQKPLEFEGQINAILNRTPGAAVQWNSELQKRLGLRDWGLRVRPDPSVNEDSPLRQKALEKTGIVIVESDTAILNETSAKAIEAAAAKLGFRSERTLSYLANAIYSGDAKLPSDAKEAKVPLIGYAIVAAVDATAKAPLGPFLPPGRDSLADDEIALLDWPDSPLKNLKPGDLVTVSYFQPEMEATLEERWKTFRFAGFVPFTGAAADPNLTPPFPGVTDKPKIKEWKAPFDINYARVTDADDKFWEEHQATPKAFVNRKVGEELFGSRFGSTTGIRIAPPTGMSAGKAAEMLREELPKHLDANAAGFVFQPIRERAEAASQGGTDFGAMMLAFSFLLIGGALILVGLLFGLAIEKRAKEIGILLASGYSTRTVRRLLMAEAAMVALLGALLGTALAVLYAKGMIAVLAALWPDPSVQGYLGLHVGGVSLILGFLGTVLMALGTVWFRIRSLVKVPIPALLRGQTELPEEKVAPTKPGRTRLYALIFAILGIVLVACGPLAATSDQRAGTFFGGGLFLMLAGLLLFRSWLQSAAGGTVNTLNRLGIRNTTRSANRSLLTVALFALATFLLVSVESFRKRPDAAFAEPTGGSGGYPLIAEAQIPIFHRPDSVRGRAEAIQEWEKVYQDRPGDTEPSLNADKADLERLKVLPFRLHGGDDASCLNLYAAAQPRVLGAPAELFESRRFGFAMSEASTAEEKANPCLLLNKPQADGSIPAIVEINTALWVMKTFLGGTIPAPGVPGKKLRIVGLLQDSVFQSEVLIGDSSFRELYPREEGYRLFLVDAPTEKLKRTEELLETGYRRNGLSVKTTASRVAAYQNVIGAYLSTFQLLGGLGLLLGAFGLATVAVRSIWERTGELALLRAVGFRPIDLQRIAFLENAILLLVGLGIGLIAALIAVVPNLALGGQLGSLRLGAILLAVVLFGLLVAVLATRGAAKAPLVPALRRD